jgi:hypothetical protein
MGSKEVKHNKRAEGKVLPTRAKNTNGENGDTGAPILIVSISQFHAPTTLL